MGTHLTAVGTVRNLWVSALSHISTPQPIKHWVCVFVRVCVYSLMNEVIDMNGEPADTERKRWGLKGYFSGVFSGESANAAPRFVMPSNVPLNQKNAFLIVFVCLWVGLIFSAEPVTVKYWNNSNATLQLINVVFDQISPVTSASRATPQVHFHWNFSWNQSLSKVKKNGLITESVFVVFCQDLRGFIRKKKKAHVKPPQRYIKHFSTLLLPNTECLLYSWHFFDSENKALLAGIFFPPIPTSCFYFYPLIFFCFLAF